MTKHGLIFMTALVPTTGHQHIIDFAANFADHVHVVISTRSNEPTRFMDRVEGLYGASNVYFYEHADDAAPQNPTGDDDVGFWTYWKQVVDTLVLERIDYVFASELYGQQVADILKADFIPVDIAREVVPVRGTDVRADLFKMQDAIAAGFKDLLRLSVVLYGAESCGKTSMARRLAKYFDAVYLPEWARPYLETVGTTITEHKLKMIVNGQYASERAAVQLDSIITVKDTDLVTTLGFYEYNGITKPNRLQWMLDDYPNDLYIVMNENICFTPDQLRFGGDKRETSTAFWIDLLHNQDREYYVVQSTDPDEQFAEICAVILNHDLTNSGLTYNKISTFKRD